MVRPTLITQNGGCRLTHVTPTVYCAADSTNENYLFIFVDEHCLGVTYFLISPATLVFKSARHTEQLVVCRLDVSPVCAKVYTYKTNKNVVYTRSNRILTLTTAILPCQIFCLDGYKIILWRPCG